MIRFLQLSFFFLLTPIFASSQLSCNDCLNDGKFTKSIALPLKDCLKRVMPRERLARNCKIIWDWSDWQWGDFSRIREAYNDEDDEEYPYENNYFDIRFCTDYRRAISAIYADLDFLQHDSKLGYLDKIAEFQYRVAKDMEEIEFCKINLPLQTRKKDQQGFLEQIERLEKYIKKKQEQISLHQKWIASDEVKYESFTKDVEKVEKEINNYWFSQLDWCLENHRHPRALYERGMLHFALGDTFEALNDIQQFLEKFKTNEQQLAQELFYRGKCEAELGLYQEAVLSLSQALQRDPSNQEIINFGEIIGYDADLVTKKQTLTTWGKIHYAKDGVHIVPTKPRG